MHRRSSRLFAVHGRSWVWILPLACAVIVPVHGRLFPDPNLEAAVRQQVFAKRTSEEPLVEADVINVSTIDAKHRGITNLAGLEKCRSLAMIELTGNKVSDLTPLAGLARLQFLDVQSNLVVNLVPLADASALQYLHLADNQVHDLSPLVGLTNLSALYLSGNQVKDITPLVGLTRLTSLYLDRNRLTSAVGVEYLRGLSSLSLSDNQIETLPNLQGLDRVHYLFLERNQIRDFKPLVEWVEADKEQRFAPYLNLYLTGNPLESSMVTDQLKALVAAGVRVHPKP